MRQCLWWKFALSLGYSDQSAFSRAFKRWTSLTPGVYRQRALTAGASRGQRQPPMFRYPSGRDRIYSRPGTSHQLLFL